MPTSQSDAVASRPSAADEMGKFGGFTTNNGETVDPKVEDLNPVAGKNIAAEERERGSTTVAEARAAKVASTSAVAKAAAVAAAEPGTETPAEGDEAAVEDADDGKVVSLAEAKAMAAAAATKRVGKAVAKQRAAERRADVAEGRLQALDARLALLEQGKPAAAAVEGLTAPAQPSTNDSTAPDPSKFQYGELDSRYIAALARFETRKEILASRQAQDAQTATAEQTRSAAEFKTALTTFTAKGDEQYDDFDEVVIQGAKDGVWPLSSGLGQLLLTSDVGVQIAYELASNPKEAARISALPLARQAAWFGKREAELSSETDATDAKPKPAKVDDLEPAKPIVKTSQAPKPIVGARGSGGKSSVSSDTTDFAAFEALARQRK